MKYLNFREVVNHFLLTNIDMENKNKKIKLRKSIIDIRNTLSEEKITILSNEISKNFFAIEDIKNASKFMLYSDFRNEVKTREIIEILIKNKKEVYLPITIKDEKKIIPKKVNSLNNLKIGSYGILEPSYSSNSIDPSLLDVVVVPGSVFDISGYRIGYGGGYYDRFLEKTNAIKIGFAFSFQVIDNIFPESHDKKMDILVTENEVFNFKKNHL